VSCYITCEADVNFPPPDTDLLFLQLNAMSDGVIGASIDAGYLPE
jgi:hypothetical protein